MEKDIEENTPKEGFNLCGIDDLELPGEQLYIIGHFGTREAAVEAQAKSKAETIILPE